jgi:ketosteroid isomerase-like protein
MKTILGFFMLAALSFGQAENEVKAAHAEFVKAAKAGDTATLDKLFAPELQYSHSNALLEDKATALAAIAKGKPNFQVHSESIKVYGKTATIRARVTSIANPNVELTVLLVWVKNGKQWQLVQRQTTRLPAKS